MQIEIIHDSLAEKIFETASLEDKGRSRIQRFLRERVEHHDSDEEDFYLSEKELRYVEPYIDNIELTTSQLEFYNKSKKLVQQQRFWAKVKKYSFIALCCTLGAGIWGLWWRNKALTEEEIAHHKLIELYEFSKQVEQANNPQEFEELKSRASDIVEEQFHDQNAVSVLQSAGLVTPNEVLTHEHYHPADVSWVTVPINGTVQTKKGRPIANAVVKVLGQSLITNKKGLFELSLLADKHALEEKVIEIIIEHDNFLSQTLEQSLHNWSPEQTIQVTLEKANMKKNKK